MKRFALATFSILPLAACSSAEVVVTVQLEEPTSDIEVQLLPYDRDAIFDSLGAAFADADRPEPEVPQALQEAREEVRQAQQEWQAAETEWADIRSRMQELNDEIQNYSRGEARYSELFSSFSSYEGRLTSVERARDRAFARFTELQQATVNQSESVQMQRDIWADEAYSDIGEVIQLKLEATGGARLYDTTDASGIARGTFRVGPGRYWVHARYELVFTELYWNVPIDVEGGGMLEIVLSRENAEERQKL